MARRNRETLFNPTWEEMVEREPLLAFSFYLSGRVNVLLDLGDEIVASSTKASPLIARMAIKLNARAP